MSTPDYNLHRLGWQSFQDLCAAIAEECLKRPVQTFLPSKDAGRDGAFIGTWENKDAHQGSSTIQCKHTSSARINLTVSLLSDEIEKAAKLAKKGLAEDYVILTNHNITGYSEIRIKEAFQAVGVGQCRIFGADWIVRQIQQSPRIRMLAPRLYGLGDLSNILDQRAYDQAQMILSALGNDLQKLVVTDAHRQSVRAITKYNFALLLGAPAAGKSTIGASLAVGAADIWKSSTIRATSPESLEKLINPHERQFFWVDDAWGSTQYHRDTVEAWNKILPLIQGAIHKGSQFLLTSRDYIWKMAQKDLKKHALPLLDQSQIVINVQALSQRERAQILYNHIKFGDQPTEFRQRLKPLLPKMASSKHFLPESARRLGMSFFTPDLSQSWGNLEDRVLTFFREPASFLRQTINNLSSDCRGAIAVIFLSGGKAPSPVPNGEALALVENSFGASAAEIRSALKAMDGSLVLHAYDEQGAYWTYRHPTVGDAFAKLIAEDPELVDVFIRGAKPEMILKEVVCAGMELQGAPVRVSPNLYGLLIGRVRNLERFSLSRFISYRADGRFAKMLIEARPDILELVNRRYIAPASEDSDAQLAVRLRQFGLLSAELWEHFIDEMHRLASEEADASFIKDSDIHSLLNQEEIDSIMINVRHDVLENVSAHVSRLREQWDDEYREYDPEDFFDEFESSIKDFIRESGILYGDEVLEEMEFAITLAKSNMLENYEPPTTETAPTSESKSKSPLAEIFRDIDK